MKLHVRNIKLGKISLLESAENADNRKKSFLKITRGDIKLFPQTAGVAFLLERAHKHTSCHGI